ncbi:MAG: glycosyltransferase family 4 protein [Tsuneonella sp.]
MSPYVTWSPRTGGTKRTHYLNRGYARAGWDVLQISCSSVMQGMRSVLRWKDLQIGRGYSEAVYFNPLVFGGNRLLRAAGTAQVATSLIPRFALPSLRIAKELRRHKVVVFEHPQMFDLALPYLRDDHFVVLDAHNIEAHLHANRLAEPGIAGAGARAMRDVERRCMQRADLVFSCSPADAAAAALEYGVDPARIRVAPNGVDVAETPFATDGGRLAAKQRLGISGTAALFIGSRWLANSEAAHRIVAMAPTRPEITYLVVGAVGEALPKTLPANVVVAGVVDDLSPWFAAADVAINPMVSGSGSNIKIFEYCAAGLPVVSTEFGARGIEDPDGRAVVTCDLSEFPARIVSLAGSSDLPERRKRARELVEQKYDWSQIAADIGTSIEAALEARPA